VSYATIDDVFARYRPLSTTVGTGSFEVTSVDVSSVYIAQAEGLVNGYLAGRYKLPLPSDPLIRRMTADLAIFDIMVERLPEVPDFMQERYNRTIELLQMIRNGKIDVASATEIGSGGDFEAWSTTTDFHPVFSPVLNELDQAADHDRVEQHQDDREDDPGHSGNNKCFGW